MAIAWTAMLPAQISSEPSGLRRRATSSGKSLYSITRSRPSTWITLPTRSRGSRLRTTWLENPEPRKQVVAQELRATDLDQRIVDLEVEQVLDPAAAGVGQSARSRQSRQHPAVAVRAQGDAVPLGQEDLPAGLVNGRHRPLAEEPDVFRRQSEPVVPREEIEGFGVGRGTGHDVPGDAIHRSAAAGRGFSRRATGRADCPKPGRSGTSPWNGRSPAECPVRRPRASRRPARPEGLRSPRTRRPRARRRRPLRATGRPAASPPDRPRSGHRRRAGRSGGCKSSGRSSCRISAASVSRSGSANESQKVSKCPWP